MWDKEASQIKKPEDTSVEGNTENAASQYFKTNNLSENVSARAETVVVATYVVRDDDDCADNRKNVNDRPMPLAAEQSDNDNFLSIVQLCDGPSASSFSQKKELSNAVSHSPKFSDSKSVLPTSAATMSAAAKEITNAEDSIVSIDNDELPYKNINANIKTLSSMQSNKPVIPLKYDSSIARKSAQNEQVQSDNVAGPQIPSLYDKQLTLQAEDLHAATREYSPAVSVEDLTLVSEMRAGSPTPSSITSASTLRAARGTSGRRTDCLRHMRRPPKEPEEYLDALFPHIRKTHMQIRQALLHAPLTDVKDNALLKKKMLELIQIYTCGCRDEFERVGPSLVLCRRLKRNIVRLLDLFHEICSSSREDRAYLYHISQLIAVYTSLEIRLSFNLTRQQKCALIHRISHIINKHLMVKNEPLAKENILRMFLHMPDTYSARFIMEPLFNNYLVEIATSSKTWCQKEMPDKLFVQYIIILHIWKEMLRDPLEQVELINRAQHFMCPTKTLHANPMYANHLPTIHTRKHAVKDILNSLKFFHDLRNAAICDDTLDNGEDDIAVVIDEVIITPFWDFGATYTGASKQSKSLYRRILAADQTECVDLTQEDDQQSIFDSEDKPLEWLTKLKERAAERVQVDESEKVICLDSDSDGELFSGSILDPSESYQDCDAFDTDYTSLDGGTSDDKELSEDEALSANGITPNCLRTYLAPRTKNQIRSEPYERTRDCDGEGDSAAVGTKKSAIAAVSTAEPTVPLIVNSFTVRGKQNMHLLNSPRFSLDIGPERFGNEDIEFHDACDEMSLNIKATKNHYKRANSAVVNDGAVGRSVGGYYRKEVNTDDEEEDDEYQSLPSTASSSTTTLGKVIFSQALQRPSQQFFTGYERENNYKRPDSKEKTVTFNERNKADSKKQMHGQDKPVKKQVKFNDNPIGPTRRPHTKLPIKPAIHLSKIQPSSRQPIFSSSPQPRFSSPSSSTSSTSESLKQMAQKANYSTLFYGERKSVLPTTIHHIPEHINAIATLFSSYKISKPPPASGAAARNNGDNNTHLNKPKYKAGPKSMHMSRKTTAMSETSKYSINSPRSVCNSQSPTKSPRSNSTSPASLRASSPVIIAPETAADPKLNKKCVVLMKENEEVLNYKRQQVAFINELLEKQREMQRQRALKRQEFQNILKQKRIEGKRLKAEISQIKKQQAAAHEKVLDTQLHQPQQSPTILNRKRLLVRERNVTFKTNTKVRSRSTTPNRSNNEEPSAKDIDTTSAAIMQSVIGDTFELAAEAMPLSDKANRTSIALKNIKAAPVLDKKSTTSIRSTTGVANPEPNTLTNTPKSSVPSTSPRSKAITTNIAAISTQTMDSMPKAEELAGIEIPGAVVPTTSKTSFKEKPKIPALLALATTPPYTRCARSMTPTRGVYNTTKLREMHTERTTDNLLVNCSSPLSTPTSSKTRLQRAPSLSPSIFMNRNRVEVRRSMQDPTSNTDFSTNGTSWLLNVSPRSFTKSLKVRLKRLQHSSTNSSTEKSPDKETNDRISMPASAKPTLLKERVANATYTVANALIENTGAATPESQIKKNKHERVQLLKQKLKKELYEMGESFVRPVNTKDENVLLESAKDIAYSQSTQTAEGRISKGARRKHTKKAQQSNKKLKLLKVTIEKHTNKVQSDLRTNYSPCDNAVDCDSKNEKSAKADVEDGLQCDRTEETKEPVGFTLATDNKELCHKGSEPPIESSEFAAEKTSVLHSENTAKQQQFSPESSRNDKHASKDVKIINEHKNPTSNNSMDVDCDNVNNKKHKRTHKHGAIVTQVVDVTPGRHVKDNLLGDLLLVAAANQSTVLNANNVLNTTPNLAIIEPPAAELPLLVKVVEPSVKRTVDPAAFDKSNNLMPEGICDKTHIEISEEMAVAVSGLTMLANRPITTANFETCKNAPEFRNENVDIILPKKTSNESISSDLQCMAEPTIAIISDTPSHAMTSVDAYAAIDEPKKSVVGTPNDNIAGPNDTGGVSGGEESSSDCLLLQLSKRVHKMSDLESIVDATTVHVIKDATMTLMSFEATPTLPAYLLNGESRDVPTPPAISTPAPTPAPTPTVDLAPEAEQPKSTSIPTPPLPEIMIKENAHAPSPKDPIISEELAKTNDSTEATVSVKVSQPSQKNMISLAAAPLQAQPEPIAIGEGLPNNRLSPPQEQQLEAEVNSPAPASAISTSDHEVSSTQEIVYTPTKRSNANALNATAGTSIPTPNEEEAAMWVQNSEIDTTHHLTESSYYMRKRTRKFSDEFTLPENKNENSAKDIIKQRRKTFSSESSLPVQFPSNITSFTKNNKELTNSSATAGDGTVINNAGQNSGGSSPSTTTEPVTKQAPPRRRNHIQKRNNSQSPLTARSRAGGSVGELNSSFVYSCSRLQPTNVDMADVERCVVLPASAVVPPVNLGNISRTYSKNNMSQIKVFVPPDMEMCLENEEMEKEAFIATTTSKRGRPKGSAKNRSRKEPKQESAEKVNTKKAATNQTKTKTVQSTKKRDNADSRPKLMDCSSKSTTTKAPTRTKHVERAPNRKRK
ncbi:uncharacterized protein LOC120778590 isoform X2 [Bactrocera tryoni]|nr:uncharacterized protein LOC120778590 isoform X2 [Bactrocera tryoni]